jgi:hypothetical protein
MAREYGTPSYTGNTSQEMDVNSDLEEDQHVDRIRE